MDNNYFTQKRYSYNIVTYNTLDDFKLLLNKAKHYAYILHDKDVDDSGTLKEPHYHILCTFDVGISWHSLSMKYILGTQNSRFIPLVSRIKEFLYLAHEDVDGTPLSDKFHYGLEAISCDSIDYWYKDNNTLNEVSNEFFLDDLYSLDVRSLSVKYGRDFIKNIDRYMNFAYNYLNRPHLTNAQAEYCGELFSLKSLEPPPEVE